MYSTTMPRRARGTRGARGKRGARGVGFLETTPTGVRFVPKPTCVTILEHQEARSKCMPFEIRGLGMDGKALAAMTGRLAPFSPCEVVDLAVCPDPRCLDEGTAGVLASCIAGTNTNPDVDCQSLYLYAMSQLPYCGRPRELGPLPACIEPETAAFRSYCDAHPLADGPDRQKNASCWFARKDPTWYAGFQAANVCGDGRTPPDLPGVPPPVPTDDGGDTGDHGSSESGMLGIGSILLLVAASAGGYYLYRHSKKGR